MYIQRTGESRLLGFLEGRKVVIVLGARQVGKTTLVQRVLAGRTVVSLNFDIEIDKTRFLAAASLSPVDAINSLGNPEYLVLDEAQRLPETGRVVKGWYDAKLPVKILLLGSSSLELLSHAAESLTGRNEKLFLPPLLFDEVIRSRDWCPETMPLSDIARHFQEPIHAGLLQRFRHGYRAEAVRIRFHDRQKLRFRPNVPADHSQIFCDGLERNFRPDGPATRMNCFSHAHLECQTLPHPREKIRVRSKLRVL